MGTIQAHQNMVFQKADTNYFGWLLVIRRLLSGREGKEATFEESRL